MLTTIITSTMTIIMLYGVMYTLTERLCRGEVNTEALSDPSLQTGNCTLMLGTAETAETVYTAETSSVMDLGTAAGQTA